MDRDGLIEVRGVHKRYATPDGGTLSVLEDIHLQVREGEILALLGPSGSGKSTLLRIVAGLLAPSAGEVWALGRPVRGVNPAVAMVFQSFALFPWLTVLDNVELGLKARGMDPRERRRRALAVIDMIGLDGFEGAYPRELSGGMRQRVGFARALAMEPPVLLLDEPFSALDVLTAENLRRDFLDLWLERRIPTRAVVMVTHSIEEAVQLADRAVILSQGPARVVAEVPISLPRPRERGDPRVARLVDHIYGWLTRRDPGAAARPPARAARVPPARSGALAGLVELVQDLGGRADLYRLGEMLTLDVEDLLPIVEALEVLGLARVEEGDMVLTDVGARFASATVLERKELFREQSLSRVPFLAQMVHVLRQKRDHRMPAEFFLHILAQSLGEEEAEAQLRTLVDWGRYAELLAYDEEGRIFYLEDTPPS